ncbi:chemotaxis protein CheY [Pseudomonas chlororaphis]|nr:chemotaxis protein CheY [Pseudomonas chlororaphis]
MPDKTMRVMIADQQHSRLLEIERLLNDAGYHRIVPVQTPEDMLKLIEAAPFGMLVMNSDFLLGCDGTALEFIQRISMVKSVLFYGSGRVSSSQSWETRNVRVFFSTSPSSGVISNVVRSLGVHE